MRVDDLQGIKIRIASPDDILEWSHGEVTKPETINYRTQRPEKDGLFCEVIFGPEKDYQCYCGKYKRIRYKGVICDRCGVEVTTSHVRRERMAHIELACPVSHIWFLRGIPSRMGLVLNVPGQQLEKVIYFAAYIVTKVDEDRKKEVLAELEREFQEKSKGLKAGPEKTEIKRARDRERDHIMHLQPLKVFSEVDYHNLSMKYGHVFEAGTGAETLKTIFETIDLKKEIKAIRGGLDEAKADAKRKMYVRLRLLEGMMREGIEPSWMFLNVLPVLPPDLRPMVQLDGGRFASSDLNDLYRRVINRNNRLKYLLDISAPEVIVRNEKRMLQEAVDALIDNSMRKGTMTQATTGGRRLLKSLADMLKGKQGRFRQNLLGKRVDYSGRSVIVVGPELQLHHVGLPKKMALELFKPFVAKRILADELAFNLRGASRLIDEETDEVWAILEDVVKDKLVLLNRAPTLHRLGIQAFEPILIEGEAIRIHPMVCKAYNADFDGDQMAVHVPLSDQAQAEARERMLSSANLLKPATGKPITVPSQDIVLGCFWLTRVAEESFGVGSVFGSKEEAVLAWETGVVGIRAAIKVRLAEKATEKTELVETTVGRILYNEALPADYPFQNESQNIRRLDAVISDIMNRYPLEEVEQVLDKMKRLGFEHSTKAGISWGMDDLIVPAEKEAILEKATGEVEKIEKQFQQGLLSREERRMRVIEIWMQAKLEIEAIIPKSLPEHGSVFTMVESGSKGSWTQIVQMTGMKGLVINPAGQIIELPVLNSYKEGFNVLEYFISTHGARKGTADTALRTSTAGYLTRRLVDVAHDAIVTIKDCKDTEGFVVLRKDADSIDQNFVFKIVGRISAETVKGIVKKGELIDWKLADQLADSDIQQLTVRSPLSCKARGGICQACYGWDMGRNEPVVLGEAVGVVAAQAIGEPGTQLTMRTFHTGGVATSGDITLGLPRVEELFEVRPPRGKALVSKVDGTVLDVRADGVLVIQPDGDKKAKSKKKEEAVEYEVQEGYASLVKKGDTVVKGQQLSEGSVDLRELFRFAEMTNVWRYIVQEVQKIYASQGVTIHDKHIEVIVRQMFSRIRIQEASDSQLVPGQIVEMDTFLKEQDRLKKAGKKEMTGKRLLLGISRVALTTESFLSAASFQETSRVLIRAALAGKEDNLRGLKENVVIGKLVPVGTGFTKK